MATVDFRAHLINLNATLEARWAHAIALREDEDPAELLADFQLDEAIPDALYPTVAEFNAFVYVLKGRYPKGL